MSDPGQIAKKYGLRKPGEIAARYGLRSVAADEPTTGAPLQYDVTAPLAAPPEPEAAPLPPMGEGVMPGRGTAPARPAPEMEPVHPAETAVHEFGSGASGEAVDRIAAGAEAVGNWIKAHSIDPLDPRSGRAAEVTGRGIDAPLKGYTDYLLDRRARRAAGQAQNPGTALTANITGGVVGGALLPQVKAAQGAGLLARGGAGLANVGVDTAVAGTTAALGAAPGQELEAAKSAMLPAAGLSTALRAPGAIKAGSDALRRVTTSVLPEDVRPAAIALTQMDEAGEALRASARRGQQTLEPTTRKITSTLSRAEEMTDAVLDYAKVGLKRAPIARAMASEGVDAQGAVMRSGQAVEQVALRLDDLMARLDDFEPAGRQAIRKAKDAIDGMRDEFADALAKTGDTGAQDAAADLFMRVDHLKRRIGKAVKSAGRGSNADAGAEDELIDMYHGLRDVLEDSKTWGEGAATIQREVNAAWTPWLTKRRAYTKTLLADEPIERGASGFDELLDADPKKVQSVLSEAGTAGNDRRERILSEGLGTTQDLVRTLAKHYDAPPDVVAKAAQVAQGAREVGETFGKTRADLVAARELRDVSAQSPWLKRGINVVSTAEDAIRSNPALATTARGIGKAADVAGELAEPARKGAAVQSGRASAAEKNQTFEERIREVAASDPEALGQYAGPLMTARTPEDFAVRHAALMATEPDYRRRIRRLSERDQQAEETSQP